VNVQFSLRTLMLMTAIGPPVIAFVWLAWWVLLIALLVAAAMAIHLLICLAIANLCGRFVASLMG
jgi:hypothetical protein